MCKQMDRIKADLDRWNRTGELPDAWKPDLSDAEFDRRVDEINREMDELLSRDELEHRAELEAQESGCVEPPRGGWITTLRRRVQA